MNNSAKIELDKLLSGNRNFVNNNPQTKNTTAQTLKKIADFQSPNACVLCCSDSRSVPEIIFDCGLGEIFTVRTAGNTIGDNVIESIEYAVKQLRVPLLIVLGHDNCGVMNYAYSHAGETVSEMARITECVFSALGETEIMNTDEFTDKHTQKVCEKLIEKSQIIREAVNSKVLYIAPCRLDHSTGKVKLLC